MYDPAIARFTGVDPIADQFPWVSTYNYAENEPVNNIDLHGLQKAGNIFERVLDYFGQSYGPAGSANKSPKTAEQASQRADRQAALQELNPQSKLIAAAEYMGMAGSDLELAGDIIAGGGLVVTVFAGSEVGGPIMVAGAYVSTAGVAMQLGENVVKGEYKEAATKIVVEAVPALSAMPLKNAANKSLQGYVDAAVTPAKKAEQVHSQKVLEGTIDLGAYLLEQILDKASQNKN